MVEKIEYSPRRKRKNKKKKYCATNYMDINWEANE